MYVKKSVLSLFILILAVVAVIAPFTGCDAVDTLFSSADTYKINAYVGGLPLNELSFITLNDEITPFFEESVSNDPDITSLIILIQKPMENYSKLAASYNLENEAEQYNDESLTRTRSIKNMDTDLTSFTMPEDLETGFYTLVFEIMSGDIVLQRTEKVFYYLGDTAFSYEGIAVHLPGISDNPQVISRGQVLLLEAKLHFDSILDPYIVWYNGKSIIAEDFYSKGASQLLWKAPEQSNFYSLSAEVFPVFDYNDLAGYKKEASILVSSKTIDINLISENIPELSHWYIFEGNLQDSKNPVQNENTNAVWIPYNGTYGLGTGSGTAFMLPKVLIPAGGDTWQLLFRFMPIEDGSILTVNFGTSANVVMDLSKDGNTLELTLSYLLKKVSRTYNLPFNSESFITMGVSFSVTPTHVMAKLNILGETVEQGELAVAPLRLEANAGNEFQILLGQEIDEVYTDESQVDSIQIKLDETEQDELIEPEIQENPDNFLKPSVSQFNAIWDEFALYKNPPIEIIAKDIIFTHAEETNNLEQEND